MSSISKDIKNNSFGTDETIELQPVCKSESKVSIDNNNKNIGSTSFTESDDLSDNISSTNNNGKTNQYENNDNKTAFSNGAHDKLRSRTASSHNRCRMRKRKYNKNKKEENKKEIVENENNIFIENNQSLLIILEAELNNLYFNENAKNSINFLSNLGMKDIGLNIPNNDLKAYCIKQKNDTIIELKNKNRNYNDNILVQNRTIYKLQYRYKITVFRRFKEYILGKHLYDVLQKLSKKDDDPRCQIIKRILKTNFGIKNFAYLIKNPDFSKEKILEVIKKIDPNIYIKLDTEMKECENDCCIKSFEQKFEYIKNVNNLQNSYFNSILKVIEKSPHIIEEKINHIFGKGSEILNNSNFNTENQFKYSNIINEKGTSKYYLFKSFSDQNSINISIITIDGISYSLNYTLEQFNKKYSSNLQSCKCIEENLIQIIIRNEFEIDINKNSCTLKIKSRLNDMEYLKSLIFTKGKKSNCDLIKNLKEFVNSFSLLSFNQINQDSDQNTQYGYFSDSNNQSCNNINYLKDNPQNWNCQNYLNNKVRKGNIDSSNVISNLKTKSSCHEIEFELDKNSIVSKSNGDKSYKQYNNELPLDENDVSSEKSNLFSNLEKLDIFENTEYSCFKCKKKRDFCECPRYDT